jgi:hypothetical protein
MNIARNFLLGLLVSISCSLGSNTLAQDYQPFTVPAAVGQRKIAVILTRVSGQAPVNCSKEYIESKLWTDQFSVRSMMLLRSFGQLEYSMDSNGDGQADIFGPYSLSADRSGWIGAASQAAIADGVQLASYDAHLIIFPSERWDSPNDGDALGDIYCGPSYGRPCVVSSNGCAGVNPSILLHEFGHTLGMLHSGLNLENDLRIHLNPADEGAFEYGDRSCPMGRGGFLVQFNAPHLEQIGWLNPYPQAKLDVTSSRSIAISPLTSDPQAASNPLYAKIHLSPTDAYFVSFRRIWGYAQGVFDNDPRFDMPVPDFGDAVHVHRFAEYTKDIDQSKLFLPALVAILRNGESFVDPVAGVRVHVNQIALGESFEESFAGVQVTLDEPRPVQPRPTDRLFQMPAPRVIVRRTARRLLVSWTRRPEHSRYLVSVRQNSARTRSYAVSSDRLLTARLPRRSGQVKIRVIQPVLGPWSRPTSFRIR